MRGCIIFTLVLFIRGVSKMQKKYAALAVFSILLMNPLNASAAGKNGVAAEVNGQKIMVSELEDAYNMNPVFKEQMPFKEFYAKLLDPYINGKMLYLAAQKAGVENSPEYKKQLKVVKEELANKIYLEQQVDKKISQDKIKEIYQQYKSQFKPEKEVKAKHILVEDEKTANEVIAKLKKGQKFDDLAKEYSIDKASELGYFTKDVMVPEFSKAAFAMKKGQYSKAPVKTKFGYHVIMVEDTRKTKPAELKQIEPQIKMQLSRQAAEEVFKDINSKTKVVKYSYDGKEIKTNQK